MKKILIIEDHADIRASLQELLESHGHGVHAAADGLVRMMDEGRDPPGRG